MQYVNKLLERMGVEATDANLQTLLADPEPLLAALIELMQQPRFEHTYKMMRTRWRTYDVSYDNNPQYVGLENVARGATFLETFERVFVPLLAHRTETFRAVFSAVVKGQRGPLLVVETGCLRIAGNWAGDGQSTFLFDELVAHHGGIVMSVDLTPESIDTARRACSPRTSLVLNDSVTFLHQLRGLHSGQISLLYLDSFDVDANNPMPSAIHHLKELTAAWPLLGPGSIVCIDDFGDGVHGKGQLVDDFLHNLNVEVLVSGIQKAWILR